MENGFVETFVAMMSANEAMQGIVSAGLIVVLSIPAAAFGQALKRLPPVVLDPDRIPAIMALFGLLLGAAMGFYTQLPMALAITVGMGAGFGSRSAHDEQKKWSTRRGAK